MTARLMLGCQGWRHVEWVGDFYREDGTADVMLGEYASGFDTVELGETFRGIPPVSLVHMWRESVPPGFSFALKVPQQVTHERRFCGTGKFMSRFLQRVTLLDDRLGPLVILMPAGFLADDDSRAGFTDFVVSLPKEFRWAVEFRSRSWLTPEVLEPLKDHGMAVVWAEGRWLARSCVLDLTQNPTAEFAYVRWNPADRRRVVKADNEDPVEIMISDWSTVLRGFREPVRTVYGYMSNRFTGRAHHDVKRIEQAVRNQFDRERQTLQSVPKD